MANEKCIERTVVFEQRNSGTTVSFIKGYFNKASIFKNKAQSRNVSTQRIYGSITE